MIRAAALATTLGAAAPALACSPALFDPAPYPVPGANCALRIDLNEIDQVHLGEAEPLGGGLILQALSEGNGCYARFHLLVHDCGRAQVMVIGAERFNLMEAMGRDPNQRPGLEIIREGALAARDRGQVPGFDDFAAQSRAQGYGTPQVLRVNQSLRFDRHRLPLGCACREARADG